MKLYKGSMAKEGKWVHPYGVIVRLRGDQDKWFGYTTCMVRWNMGVPFVSSSFGIDMYLFQ